jgi:hypothetical protein
MTKLSPRHHSGLFILNSFLCHPPFYSLTIYFYSYSFITHPSHVHSHTYCSLCHVLTHASVSPTHFSHVLFLVGDSSSTSLNIYIALGSRCKVPSFVILGILCPSCLADLGQSDLFSVSSALSRSPPFYPLPLIFDSPTYQTPLLIQHLLVIVHSSRPTSTFILIQPEHLHCVECY